MSPSQEVVATCYMQHVTREASGYAPLPVSLRFNITDSRLWGDQHSDWLSPLVIKCFKTETIISLVWGFCFHVKIDNKIFDYSVVRWFDLAIFFGRDATVARSFTPAGAASFFLRAI